MGYARCRARDRVFWIALAPVPAETMESMRASRANVRAQEAQTRTAARHGAGGGRRQPDPQGLDRADGGMGHPRGLRALMARKPTRCSPRGLKPDIHLLRPAPAGQRKRAGPAGTLADHEPQARSALLTGDLKSAALQAAAEEAGYFVLPKPVWTRPCLRMLLRRWLHPA